MANEAQFLTVAPSGSDVHARVPSNTIPQLLLSASQEQRSHASIFNDSSATIFLKFGGSVGMSVSGSAGIYDLKITSASYFELPKPIWMGEVWGSWDADVVGFARIFQMGLNK